MLPPEDKFCVHARAPSSSMRVVALVSGGKDSCYSMMKCVAHGHTIVALANLHPPTQDVDEMDSFMYQTVGHQHVDAIAQSMELPLFRQVALTVTVTLTLTLTLTRALALALALALHLILSGAAALPAGDRRPGGAAGHAVRGDRGRRGRGPAHAARDGAARDAVGRGRVQALRL